MKRFDKKLNREYRFVTNPKKERMMIVEAAISLIKKIEENIAERERKGIKQDETRFLLTSLLKA